jgi:hypothetical protein
MIRYVPSGYLGTNAHIRLQPFYEYQDKIIALVVFVAACFTFAASEHPAIVPHVLLGFGALIAGLSYVNCSAALARVLVSKHTTPYWIQTSLLGLYWLLLLFAYVRPWPAGAKPEGKRH